MANQVNLFSFCFYLSSEMNVPYYRSFDYSCMIMVFSKVPEVTIDFLFIVTPGRKNSTKPRGEDS